MAYPRAISAVTSIGKSSGPDFQSDPENALDQGTTAGQAEEIMGRGAFFQAPLQPVRVFGDDVGT
jgi:hypothetical protein